MDKQMRSLERSDDPLDRMKYHNFIRRSGEAWLDLPRLVASMVDKDGSGEAGGKGDLSGSGFGYGLSDGTGSGIGHGAYSSASFTGRGGASGGGYGDGYGSGTGYADGQGDGPDYAGGDAEV